MRALSFLLLACSAVLQAQSGDRVVLVVTPGELMQRRQEYLQAWRDWDQADPSLERDLLRVPADQMLKRIDTAATKRAALSQSKTRYFQAMRQRYESTLNKLVQPQRQGTIAADVNSRDKETLREIISDYSALDQEIQKAQAVGQNVLLLQKQRDELAQLQNLYLQRQQALEKLTVTDQTLEENRRKIQENVAKLVGTVRAQEDTLGSETDLWSKFYDSLRTQVKKAPPTRTVAAATPPAPAPAAPKPQTVVPQPTTPPPAAAVIAPPTQSNITQSRYVGVWVYSNLNNEARRGEYPDKNVYLQITQEGNLIRGFYRSEVLVHPSERLESRINLTFEGTVQVTKAVVTLQPPYPGRMQLHLVDDNTLEIDFWQVDEATVYRRAPRLDFVQGTRGRRLVRQSHP